jgi:hypothetical protein
MTTNSAAQLESIATAIAADFRCTIEEARALVRLSIAKMGAQQGSKRAAGAYLAGAGFSAAQIAKAL